MTVTGPVAFQAPIIGGAAVELAKGGRYFWKDVLKTGTINYKNQKLDFTPEYLDDLVTAHRDGVFDDVPLVFAGADNAHTQDVERIRGSIVEMERRGDRLRALVHASTDEAAEHLRNNPKIGCSVRIEHPIERADGRTFKAGVQHVLATANPRINGLGPWEPVDLAAGSDDRQVIDLSTLDFADDAPVTPQAGDPGSAGSAAHDPVPGGTSAADNTTEEAGTVPDTPTEGGGGFSDADIQKLRDMLNAFDAQTPAEEPEPEFTEEELRQAAADFLGLTDQPDTTDEAEVEEPVEEREPATVGLSWEAQRSIDLAQSRADRMEIELAQMRAERDETRFGAEVREFADTYGIDPRITALAKPLMIGQHVVELSNGDEVDAGRVIREVMVEMAKSQRLDLSKTVWDAPDDDGKEAQEKAERADWAQNYVATQGFRS